MTRAGLPPAVIESMWQAYQTHQTAFYVSQEASVSPHTAQKYIKTGHFAIRLSKIKAKAIEIADDNAQIDAISDDLIKLGNIKNLLSDAIISRLKKGSLKPTIAELDRIVRLIAFIRGEPDDPTEEYYDFRWIEEVEQVKGKDQKALESDT